MAVARRKSKNLYVRRGFNSRRLHQNKTPAYVKQAIFLQKGIENAKKMWYNMPTLRKIAKTQWGMYLKFYRIISLKINKKGNKENGKRI